MQVPLPLLLILSTESLKKARHTLRVVLAPAERRNRATYKNLFEVLCTTGNFSRHIYTGMDLETVHGQSLQRGLNRPTLGASRQHRVLLEEVCVSVSL